MAYELLHATHGCGYATEAGRALVTWASDAGYQRLTAGVWDWNLASRRVLDKLGFREWGRVQPDAVYGSSLLYVRELLNSVSVGTSTGTGPQLRRTARRRRQMPFRLRRRSAG